MSFLVLKCVYIYTYMHTYNIYVNTHMFAQIYIYVCILRNANLSLEAISSFCLMRLKIMHILEFW